ncbi:MAG TPA: arginine--tRNA ligase, partial [Porticoccaceae bacterium]|nr:arginine--tRNA ligase [Porticoccaceae bacterium]
MSVRALLDQRLRMAMAACAIPAHLGPQLARASRPEFGDFQANGALAAAKEMKAKPRELAERILAAAQLDEIVARAEIAGPGFINLHLADDFLARLLD